MTTSILSTRLRWHPERHEWQYATFGEVTRWAALNPEADWGEDERRHAITDAKAAFGLPVTVVSYAETRHELEEETDEPPADSDQYTITVTFDRYRSEDLEQAKSNFPELEDNAALLAQFALELQGCSTRGEPTGFWAVVDTSLAIPPKVTPDQVAAIGVKRAC